MKTLVYLNPQSGQGRALKIYNECRDAISAACGSIEVIQHPEQISVVFNKTLFDRVVIIGGDGTFHVVVNELMKLNDRFHANPPELSLLSSGTGCDLSRSLKRASPISKTESSHKPGASPSLVDELERLTANIAVPFDIGRAKLDDKKEIFYCNSASVGLGGYACGQQKNWNKKLPTSLSYLLPGFKAFFAYEGADLQIQNQGQEVYLGHSIGVMIYNGAFSGGGMLWAPKSSICDGLLDLMVIKNLGVTQMPQALKKLFLGKINEFPDLVLTQGKHFTVRSLKNKELPLELDGEYFEAQKIEFNIEASAFKILVSP